ncbi:hypothetical protein [Nonomuraea sp. NEAU-A123]|uniref:hypothetical protein n=1 Tax=Nonomuraea sp. NEAU-A123 TaxID=2839649 RepID=UPI001BE45547|nr:hypothetical protein [Nonomuraea sp. NEAU-A123]MBT2235447.1 hypothetical protein [Nonomuraea sp. NEAU-A123]
MPWPASGSAAWASQVSVLRTWWPPRCQEAHSLRAMGELTTYHVECVALLARG